jgi:hypothetical protein
MNARTKNSCGASGNVSKHVRAPQICEDAEPHKVEEELKVED